MGYYSRLEGRITIDPPLSWSEVRSTGFSPADSDLPSGEYKCVHIEIVEETQETDVGTLIVRYGVAIVPVSDDQEKFYGLAEQMAQLCAHPVFKNRTLTGHILRYGEETGDLERFDGKGRSEKARMVWPDGTVEDGR